MVGDTEYGMDMAKRIAILRVAVSYSAHHIDRLHGYQPQLCVDSFPEFIDWVFKTAHKQFVGVKKYGFI